MAVRLVKEGLAELELPEDERLDNQLGPQRAGGKMVFYNPAARPSRDFTVLMMRALRAPPKGWRMLDGLCGSGVRGLRVALEVENVAEVVLNDGDDAAVALAQRQVERLGLKNVRTSGRSLESALSDSSWRFDLIDIDPFGSPLRFFPSAAQRVARPGYIAATATDLAALCGVFAHTCVRRYGALPLRNEWKKETAARILLGAIARACGAIEREVEPVATFCTQHFVRVMVRLRRGHLSEQRAGANLGFIMCDPAGLERPRVVKLHDVLDGKGLAGQAVAGPLWVGELHDPEVLARVAPPEWITPRSAAAKFVALAPGELGLPPWHFSLDQAARRLKGSPPPTVHAVEALRAQGFKAARTHFDSKGVKTDAAPSDLLAVVSAFTAAAR